MVVYSQSKNDWVKVNHKMLEQLKKQIVEYDMAGGSSFANISLKALVKVFDVLIEEIERLENTKRELINKVNELKKE